MRSIADRHNAAMAGSPPRITVPEFAALKSSGKKITVPFEQIIIFSTNLQPESLVDEAFLRRVPFKINIGDPTMEEFVELFKRACEANDIPWRAESVEKLIAKHYRGVNRPFFDGTESSGS